MRVHWLLLLLAVGLPGLAAGTTNAPLTIHINVAEVPGLTAWAEHAKSELERMYPVICEKLASPGFTPANVVTLAFKKDMPGVAHRQGTTIVIAANWVLKHPDDTGLVIHEATHIVQDYPNYTAPWLVEGIADYIRFLHYEPAAKRPRFNPATVSYTNGYQVAAVFLGWIEQRYDAGIVPRLNGALRGNQYRPEMFREATGHELPELWAEFAREPWEKKK